MIDKELIHIKNDGQLTELDISVYDELAHSVVWANNNGKVGKLTWNDGILKFEGNAEESAKEFLKYLADYSGFTFLCDSK